MKWVLRILVAYVGVMLLVFGWSAAAAYFPLARSIDRAISTPTVGVAIGDELFTSEVTFFDQDFYGFDWISDQPVADPQALDIILIPLEGWDELETSAAIRGLGLLWLTLRERPLPDAIIRVRTIGLTWTWSWLPLQVTSRELVVLNGQHFVTTHQQECFAELLARVAIDWLEEDFRRGCREL